MQSMVLRWPVSGVATMTEGLATTGGPTATPLAPDSEAMLLIIEGGSSGRAPGHTERPAPQWDRPHRGAGGRGASPMERPDHQGLATCRLESR